MVVHVASQTTASGWATTPEGSDVTLGSPSAVLCNSLTTRPRPTLLSGSVNQRSRSAVGGEAPHVLEFDRSTPESYERLKLLGACLTQQAAVCGMTPDLTVTAARYFLHWCSRTLSWTRSHADLCWYPLRPTRANGRCLLWLLKNLRPTWHG
jgi:hypothetical protein